MKPREKDKKLANSCQALSEAASAAIAWASDNRELLGPRYEEMTRLLAKQVVEARKLARAAERPMSIGIFGPSQHGKSFLSNGLISVLSKNGEEKFSPVRFGNGPGAEVLDFINEVNPVGLRECTGLVTRFTLRAVESPPGFAVPLRLMNEVDIVKIFANSFVFELKKDGINALTLDYVNSVLDSAEGKAGSFSDNLSSEDVYELEDYFKKFLRLEHPMTMGELSDEFWPRAARLLPALAPVDRATLMSLLWGEIPEFTAVYLELKAALDALGHPHMAFVSTDAIRNRAQGETILHVLTMRNGLTDNSGAIETIVTKDGKQARLRKPIIAAIALELTAQLETPPWSFFEDTDLLDFPGCRDRGKKERAEYFSNPEMPYPTGEAFLRGKVALMFDVYADELDINYLVACHKVGGNPRGDFPPLVRNWIARTCGDSPQSRDGRANTLFYGATWSDTLLNVSAGAAQDATKFDNALNTLELMRGFSEWTPGKPFDNAFLLRSPDGAKLTEFFDIKILTEEPNETWIELDLLPEKVALKDKYGKEFADSNKGQQHFSNAQAKWNAMMTANDGGVRYLAQSLENAANPDIKYDQLAPKCAELGNAMSGALGVYYESGDLAERVRERLAVIQEVVDVLQDNKDLVPRFIAEFQPSADMMARTYLESRRHVRGSATTAGSTARSFGELAMEMWSNVLARRYGDELLCHAYGLECHLMQRVAEEIERGARQASMVEAIDRRVNDIENYSQDSAKNADKVGLTIALLTGEFVSYLGCRGEVRLPNQPDSPLFQRSAYFDAANLPVFPRHRGDMTPQRTGFMTDWLTAILFMTELNASSSQGSLIDIAQNERLGDILKKIESAA